VDAPATLAGLLTVAVIGFHGRGRSSVSEDFGRISYPLYLLHWPLGHLTLGVPGLELLRPEGEAPAQLVRHVSRHRPCAESSEDEGQLGRPARAAARLSPLLNAHGLSSRL
jgi:hypothetical protein